MNNNAKIGGILSIISGAFSVFYLLGAVFSAYLMPVMFGSSGLYPGPDSNFITMLIVFYIGFGLFYAVAGALAIAGGIFALKRKRWGLALAGSIAGTITFFPTGIPAIVFTVKSKSDFNQAPVPEQAPAN